MFSKLHSIWLEIVFFIFAIILFAICLYSCLFVRWVYKRRLIEKSESMLAKYQQDEKDRKTWKVELTKKDITPAQNIEKRERTPIRHVIVPKIAITGPERRINYVLNRVDEDPVVVPDPTPKRQSRHRLRRSVSRDYQRYAPGRAKRVVLQSPSPGPTPEEATQSTHKLEEIPKKQMAEKCTQTSPKPETPKKSKATLHVATSTTTLSTLSSPLPDRKTKTLTTVTETETHEKIKLKSVPTGVKLNRKKSVSNNAKELKEKKSKSKYVTPPQATPFPPSSSPPPPPPLPPRNKSPPSRSMPLYDNKQPYLCPFPKDKSGRKVNGKKSEGKIEVVPPKKNKSSSGMSTLPPPKKKASVPNLDNLPAVKKPNKTNTNVKSHTLFPYYVDQK